MADPCRLFQTVMFADIAGSTQLYEKQGDSIAKQIIDTCIQNMVRIVTDCGGSVVKTIGDEIMCRFDHPDGAAKAAISIEEGAVKEPELVSSSLQIRIGLHHGAVIEEGRDLFGDAVNLAARMAGLAKAGQIITTRQTLDLVRPEISRTARLVDQTQVKGKQSAIEIYELAWGQPEEMTLMGTLTGQIVTAPASRDALMILDLDCQHISVSQDHPMITMGRDACNRIVIDHPKVSRLHARIEMRKDKFILVDQSTNGTFVNPQHGQTIFLRRDEIALAGEGLISLGRNATKEGPTIIRYQTV